MEAQEDVIVDIAKNREKYFGCSGKMLLPCAATVEAQLQNIPESKLITTELLQKRLAAQFNVEVACPVVTRKALETIANNPNKNVAYWRVIKKNGELMARFPGGVEGQAAHLKDEGFTIDAGGNKPKVEKFRDSLVRFG
ncbi:MGMT family protein [Dictyobacter kobayashii]|uniref:Uncharacterized protein n=1 Tax=Dictyobacter kobayashii TaxID=2014872 RepID=A0A402AYP3_9CHLR|nr:MGMT family protein [Dictyobacter kobayashii]GCE24198.1 hypothetical protein KDK_79980 [Dictyobacter kobayashii]